MSIRFLTKQEPSSFTEGTQPTTTSPWIRLDVKQEVTSEFSYIPPPPSSSYLPPPPPAARRLPAAAAREVSLPLFQRPKRTRITKAPPAAPINTFEDALEAIRSGRAASSVVDRTPILKPKPSVVLPRRQPQSLRQSLNDDEYTPFDKIRPSSSSRSSSRSGDPSRSSSVELGSGKKYSLACLSTNEVKERKKEQNILAARRYRQRRNEMLNEKKEEIDKLEQRKNELQILEASLAGQIQALKDLFAEQLKQRVGGDIPIFDSKATLQQQEKKCDAFQASFDDDVIAVEYESNASAEKAETSVVKVEANDTVENEEFGERMNVENSETAKNITEEMEESVFEEAEVTKIVEVQESEDQYAESQTCNDVAEEMDESDS